MTSVDTLIERVQRYDAAADTDLIRRAFEFSERVHQGQKRESGEPYFVHPVEVAGLIADLKLDAASVATGLLHDTVEDTLTTLEQVDKEFGPEVAQLVDGVTKISQITFRTREEKQAENFRKMVLAMSEDIRIIVIKLADRMHNMRTLEPLSLDRQQSIAQETLDIYAPLAHRLGIYWVKSELEDNALRYLHPEVYHQLKRDVAKRKAERTSYVDEVISILKERLDETGIEAEVTGRPKHFYSIYQKMQSQNLLFEQIFDLIAFRVVVGTLPECYSALGIVHAEWKPVPGRFKDYIAVPKENGYQSLHTTVIGPHGERIEVQIRTHAMHRVAEEGIAAHWRYKAPGIPDTEDSKRFTWLRRLLEWQQNTHDPQEFMLSVKQDLFSEEVYVFTPKGELLSFPEGSTVIDFAYRIHSEVGEHCAGARVSGRIVPLRYQLHSGDTVEIITTAHQSPSKDWLNFVKTSRARVKIRNWIKHQERDRSIEVGSEILERDLKRYRLSLAEIRKDGRLAQALKELDQPTEDDLLASVGYGRVSSNAVLARLLPADQLQSPPPEPGPLRRLFQRITRQDDSAGVQVSGIENMLLRFGKCCEPLPGERITGFITRGHGVTVHAANCPRVLGSDPQRRIDAKWTDGRNPPPRTVTLQVMSVDAPGMLAAISKAISKLGVNIIGAHVTADTDKKATATFDLTVTHVDQLNQVSRAISRVKGVMRVTRMREQSEQL